MASCGCCTTASRRIASPGCVRETRGCSNRAVVQPDPVVALGLAADTMAAGDHAESLEDLFLRLEAADVMLRIDPDVVPTMAKTPTLGAWELELLRTIGTSSASDTSNT